MTIEDARVQLFTELQAVYDRSEAMNITVLVLEHITGLTGTDQVRNKETILTPEQADKKRKITERLKKDEPVQYVLGEAWFAGMRIAVNKSVLIPRPETEELVDWVVKEAKTPCSILDIGAGSGCIPIALKKRLPAAEITAVDVCSDALFTATENAISHETEIEFRRLDFLDESGWQALGKFDLIISNPPYVSQHEEKSMHQRVTQYEPHLALFVPDNDPLIFYRKLADFSLQHLMPGGRIYAEINESLGAEVEGLFQSKGLKETELRKDMQGKDRMVKARLIV